MNDWMVRDILCTKWSASQRKRAHLSLVKGPAWWWVDIRVVERAMRERPSEDFWTWDEMDWEQFKNCPVKQTLTENMG